MHEQLRPLGRLGCARDKPLIALVANAASSQPVKNADDRCEQIVEIVRHATRQLPHRLHLLGLPQGVFRLSKTPLLGNPLGDVVHELVGSNPLAVLISQRAVLHLVDAQSTFGIAELADRRKLLAGERPAPDRFDSLPLLRLGRQSVEHRLANSRSNSEEPLKLVSCGAIDGQPAEVEVSDLHEDIRPLDKLCQNTLLGQSGGYALFKCLVQMTQTFLGRTAFGYVIEEDCDAMLRGIVEPKGIDVEPAAQKSEPCSKRTGSPVRATPA